MCRSWVRTFKPNAKRKRVYCPVCGSLERHRLLWLYFKNETPLFRDRLRMLHVAPENCFVRRFRRRFGLDYLSIDLKSPLADRKMDLCRLELEDESFDVFYAGHVLEHVPDDRRALTEIRRVLKPGGWAVIMVPVSGETTVEDASVTDPAERKARYGEADHVRSYGADFTQRLEQCGFRVREVDYARGVNRFRFYRLGLCLDTIYHCTKPE